MLYAGMELPDVAEGEMALDAVVLMQIIDSEGRIKYREWKSGNLHPIHALGMVETFRDTLKALIMGTARPNR